MATYRLGSFIHENMEPILQAWEDFARTIEPPALTMDDTDLRDHARQMLQAISADLDTPQTEHERCEKSRGLGKRGEDDTAAETHAEARLLSGYTMVQLVSEYRALRSSVLTLWAADIGGDPHPTHMDDVTRFNEAVDQALAEADAVISVTNHGEPVAPDKLAAIVDPMVRIAASVKNEGDYYTERTSLGIGLYISREIVHAHGGNIELVSTVADGTTFTVTIPRLPRGFQAADATRHPPAVKEPPCSLR